RSRNGLHLRYRDRINVSLVKMREIYSVRQVEHRARPDILLFEVAAGDDERVYDVKKIVFHRTPVVSVKTRVLSEVVATVVNFQGWACSLHEVRCGREDCKEDWIPNLVRL